MAPPQPLDNFQFTFESYLDDSQIEADSDQSGHRVFDTKSLTESITRSEEAFGRTYHSYRAGSYHYPDDPSEIERLEEQYEIMKEMMDGHIFFAPFTKRNPPGKVLDIATGTGTWAIEFGDEFPESKVIGTDLSPIQPDFVPPNVRFFVEDSGEDWDYPPDFDYIHTRLTLGCWANMKTQILQQAFDHLRPNGWLECQEILSKPCCDDGTMPEDFAWARWENDVVTASGLAQRQIRVGEELKEWFRDVGFVDVHEAIIKMPIGGWPRDLRLKHMGMLWQRNLIIGLSGFSLGLFNRFLGRSVEEIEVSLVETRQSLFNTKIHAYQKIFVVWGRKPDLGK